MWVLANPKKVWLSESRTGEWLGLEWIGCEYQPFLRESECGCLKLELINHGNW
jgi:hypothetical protein